MTYRPLLVTALVLIMTIVTVGCRDYDQLVEMVREAPAPDPSDLVYRQLTGSDKVTEMRAMHAFVTNDLGYDVTSMEHDRLAGRTFLNLRRIYLNESLNTNSATCVLAHEAAHVLEPEELRYRGHEHASEAVAEAVAFLVCDDLQISVSEDYILAFIKHHDPEGEALSAYREHILSTAQRIRTAVHHYDERKF